MILIIFRDRFNYYCYECNSKTGGIIINGKVHCIVCKARLWRCPCGYRGSANNGKCNQCGQNLDTQKEKENGRVYAKV